MESNNKEFPKEQHGRKEREPQNLNRSSRLHHQSPLGPHAKERWLLTRKTWRYMTDTVGNFLPLEYRQVGQVGGGGAGASLVSSAGTSALSKSIQQVSTGDGGSERASQQQRVTTSIGTQSSPETIKQMRAGAEQSFSKACDNQKHFLIWTRNRPTPLSGPALQEQRLLARAEGAGRRKHSTSGATDDSSLRAMSPSTSTTTATTTRTDFEDEEEDDDEIWLERDEYDEYDDDDEVVTVRERKSSIQTGSGGVDGDGAETGEGCSISEPGTTESLGIPDDSKVYVSVGTQTEGFSDPVFPPYALQQLQFPQGALTPGYGVLPYYFTTNRRISIDSVAGGGAGTTTTTSSSETQETINSSSTAGSRYYEGHQAHPHHQYPDDFIPSLSYPSATSCDSVARFPIGYEYNKSLAQKGKGTSSDSSSCAASDIPSLPGGTVSDPGPYPHQRITQIGGLRRNLVHPPSAHGSPGGEQSSCGAAAKDSPQLPNDPLRQQREPGVPCAGSGAPNSVSSDSGSVAAATSLGETNPTTSTTATSSSTAAAGTDKKSEESGYSSSISDTVMRYLKMARKNSKTDKKDIDRFKTVNYDRSLRNIKSKNVTIEEALEHDRNKAAAAANGTAPHQPTAAEEFSAQIASNQLEKLQEEYCQRIGITSVSTPPLPTGPSTSTPIQVGKLPKEGPKPAGQPGGPPGGPPPKRLLPSVGIQAGESIIKFLKLFNRRKQSDLSSPSYPSSESNVDTVTSPRSSLATTIVSTSGSDPDLYPILFSSREMSAALSPRASFDTVIYDENQEFDDVFTSSCSTSPPVLHQSFMPSYNVVVPGKIPNPQSPLSVANLFPSLRLSARKGSVPDTGGAQQQLQSGFPIKVKSASSTKHSSSVFSPLTQQTIRRSSNSYSNVQEARGGHHHGHHHHHHHQSIPGSSSLSTKTPKSKSDDISMLYGGGGGHSLKYTSAGGQYIHNMGHEARMATSAGAENPYNSPGDLKQGHAQQQQLTQQQQQFLMQQQMLMQMQQQYSSSSSPQKSKSSHAVPRRPSSADQHASAAAIITAGGSSNNSNSTSSNKPRKGSIGGGQNIMKRLFSSQSKKSDSDKDSVVGYGGEEGVRVVSAGGTNAALLQTTGGSGIFGGVGVGGGLNSGQGQVQQQQQLLYSTTITSDREGDKSASRNDSIAGDATTFTSSDSRPLSRGSGGGSTKSNRNESVSVMQKSKSSSSVLHNPSSSSSEKSYSTHRSRTKLFHKHKKEKEVVNVPKPSNWAPQAEAGVWTSLLSGRQIVLEPTLVQKLSEPERLALQKLSLQKLRTQNLGVDVKIPREKTNIGSSGTKAKRRPYLLKKKALSTGFFDSGKRDDLSKEGASGLVFSISLSECVKNDLERRQGVEASEGLSTINLAATQVGSKTHDTSRQSISCDLSNSDKQVSPSHPGSKYGAVERHDTSNVPSQEFGQVPVLVQECVRHLEKYGLHTTGIFRVGSSLKRTRQLREEIDAGREIKLGEDHSPHDVATLLKEFLRDLPEPLLCRDLYNAFLKAPKLRNRKSQMECMQNLINLLPVANRDTLYTLLSLFAKVVDNSQDVRMKTGEILTGNKMEAYSLATLIAPNILPCLRPDGTSGSEEQQAAQTRERRDSIDVVSYLIANYQDLFTVTPETLNEVYVDLLDTNPEVVESIIRTKFPAATQEIEDLESGIITFRSSQYGDSGDDSDPRRGSFKRREIVFHDFIGGNGRTSRSGSRHEIFAFARDDDGKESGGCHSGGESDSSSSKSTSRWFRKSKNTEHKSRASSDSGSDKVHTSKTKSKDFVIDGNKRANSLDSVNMMKEVGRGIIAISDVPPATNVPTDRLRSSSDQALKIPVDMTRRQSSPMLESRIINERGERERSGNQGGVIKASLKFTVPMNIDDTDIPFIEEDNSEGHSLHSRRGPTQGTTSPVEDVGGGSFPYEEIEARICLGVPSNEYHRRMSAAAGQISSDKKSPAMPRVGSQGSLGSVSESKTVRHLTPHLKSQEPKTLGKETKGANITGIIKSKTADFEKLASKSMGGVFHPSKGRKSSDTKSSSGGELDNVTTPVSASPKQGSNSSLAKAAEKEVPSPVPGRIAKSDSSKSVSGGVPGVGTVWKRSEIISSPMRKKKGS